MRYMAAALTCESVSEREGKKYAAENKAGGEAKRLKKRVSENERHRGNKRERKKGAKKCGRNARNDRNGAYLLHRVALCCVDHVLVQQASLYKSE